MIRLTKGKKDSRLKRAIKSRRKISETVSHRISVFRSGRHIYAQLSTSNGEKVITVISTNKKTLRKKCTSNSIENSKIIGKEMAEFIKKQKITKVAFDRSGYKYHGKVKALAEAIRENGVKI